VTNEQLPAPLVPSHVDLRGYEYMPLYGERLFKSETWIAASAEAKVAALRLWWHAYAHEVPAASLPDNDKLLAEYAGYGVAVRTWLKIKPQVMPGFVLCDDGRLYHDRLSEWAIEAWEMRSEHRETVEAKSERQKRWRERCKLLGEQLRSMGITPPRGASLETLERLHKASTRDGTGDASVDGVEIGKKGTERKGKERTSKPAVGVTPTIDARANGSHGGEEIPETATPTTTAPESWRNPVWLAASAQTVGVERRRGERDEDFADRVYSAIEARKRAGEAEATRRAR
jgi:hypothetical protein